MQQSDLYNAGKRIYWIEAIIEAMEGGCGWGELAPIEIRQDRFDS